MKIEHTESVPGYKGTHFDLYDVSGEEMVFIGEIDTREDAAFIVKAVNNHYQLLGALKKLAARFPEDMSDDGTGRMGFTTDIQKVVKAAEEAIKQAEKE